MPRLLEIRIYLAGLWRIIKGDAGGLNQLDLTDRGMLRSFWAILWCLPPSFISWLWFRQIYRVRLPESVDTGAEFLFRLAMLEGISWFVPLILSGMLCLMIGQAGKFPAIVFVINWLAIPLSWAYGLICLLLLAAPAMATIAAFVHLALLTGFLVSFSRIMRVVIGSNPAQVTAFVLTLVVPNMLVTETLQRFLGINPF